ncbi:MAG: sugar-binding transcriptional regulator [Hyphomicrobiales bacterium]|nr:sugar-binding transcriptional regulator [Hyphomicrobiales bacterium]
MNRPWGKGSVGSGYETLARVAHLYYVLGYTQAEIAKRIGITRFKVHRLLVQARERGMVRIEIDVPFTARLDLESMLVSRFGLGSAFVCPSEESDDVPLSEVIGQYAAMVCASLLRDGQTIATSWGSTLRALATSVDPGAAQDIAVVSMIGSLATRSSQDRYEAASVLADRLSAECFYLPGPILCDSAEAKEAINAQPTTRLAIERAANADIAFLSIGGRSMSSLRECGMLSDRDYEEAKAAGAIGNLLGRFIGEDGKPIDHPLNTLCVGIGPEEIRGIPCRVMCAGGERKVDVIRAVLRREQATILVTDEQTAHALVEPGSH